jgi:hypothetical protein
MANALLGWLNSFAAGTISGSSAASELAVANLGSDQPSIPWQTTGTSEWALLDAGSEITWNGFGLFATNLTTAATVRWRLGPAEAVVEETPSLDLDFITRPTLSQIGATLTFTRASTATYVAATGAITVAAVDVPRFDTDPVTLAPRGLLIEETRTNILLQSASYGASTALNLCTATVDGAVTAPDGTAGAYLVTATGSGDVYAEKSATVTANATVAGSIFLKRGTSATVSFRTIFVGGATVDKVSSYNFDTDTLSAASGVTMAREAFGNGWVRVAATLTDTGSNTTYLHRINPGNSGATVYVWGAQAEVGAAATSYIPTTGSTAARQPDVCSTPTTGWFEDSAGSIYGACQLSQDTTALVVWQISDGTTNNRHVARVTTATGFVDLTSVVSGSNQATFSLAVTPGMTIGSAFAYGVNDFAGSFNGAAIGTDTAGSVPAGMTSLHVGGTATTEQLNGWVRAIRYYPRRLTNAQLVALSGSGSSITAGYTYDSGVLSAGIVPGYRQSVHLPSAAVTGRYLRLDLSDPSNPDGYLRIGAAFAGPMASPAISIAPDAGEGWQDDSVVTTSKGGQEYVSIGSSYRVLDVEFANLTDAELYGIAHEIDRIASLRSNVLFIPDPASAYLQRAAVFGRIVALDPPTRRFPGVASKRWRIKERK